MDTSKNLWPRNTKGEKQAIKEGRIPEEWKDKPNKLAQKDREPRWTIKYTKAKAQEDGSLCERYRRLCR